MMPPAISSSHPALTMATAAASEATPIQTRRGGVRDRGAESPDAAAASMTDFCRRFFMDDECTDRGGFPRKPDAGISNELHEGHPRSPALAAGLDEGSRDRRKLEEHLDFSTFWGMCCRRSWKEKNSPRRDFCRPGGALPRDAMAIPAGYRHLTQAAAGCLSVVRSSTRLHLTRFSRRIRHAHP